MVKIIFLIVAQLIGWSLVGCDSEKPKKKNSENIQSAVDVPTDIFSYVEATELGLDADAFLNTNTKEDFHVGTLYLEGGTGKNCASWTISVTGEEIKLARADTLKAADQTRLNEETPGSLNGVFETRGTIAGIRFVVKKDSIVTFSGSQSYCKTLDKADFNVEELVKKNKLYEIFRGFDGVKGMAFMTLRFTDGKNAATVVKIKEELAAARAAATPVDPATTPPAAEPAAVPAADPAAATP